MEQRIDHTRLRQQAFEILKLAGLPENRATTVADTLLEGDLMGHRTHGLALLAPYVDEILSGGMLAHGNPEVIRDLGAAVTWNGKYLPGPWLVHYAIDLALARVRTHPVITISIGQSHHIGSLASYMLRITEENLVGLLISSDPRNKTVAPFGATEGLYSPNPIAMGIPTGTEPIILDISMSATTNALVNKAYQQGEKLPHPWLLTPDGDLTDDPSTFKTSNPSTIIPLGGLDNGHKGFALGIMAEVLTSALCGIGRSTSPNGWGASVFLQITDPAAFGGISNFEKEVSFFRDKANRMRPVTGSEIRLPGDRALKLRKEQLEAGVIMSQEILNVMEASLKKVSQGR